MIENHRDIINGYANRIAEAHTFEEMKDIATALLAHVSYLLGRESLKEADAWRGEEHVSDE